MYYCLYILLAIILADFLTGLFHWWEDRYGNPSWPIIGPLVIIPNIQHHKYPRKFTEGNYWKRNYTAIIPSLVLSMIFYFFQQYFMCLVFLISSQSNEFHCWQHMKTNKLIRWFQNYKLIQGVRGHALHHARPYDRNYCVITTLVNPILSSFSFWTILEISIGFLTGIYPRKEREEY